MPRPLTTSRTARRNPCHPEVPRGVRSAFRLPPSAFPLSRRGLTLIEMLIATAITLLMMAAVVNLFANLSGSIRNRRAVIELSSQIRQVRQRLARDLAGCTVPVEPTGLVPWQRSGEGIGYFEIIEGGHSDARPSDLVDGIDDPADGNAEIDYATSTIPSGGDSLLLLPDQVGNRTAIDGDVTNGGGLGDADDILALTVRSDDQPFVGSYDVRNPLHNTEPNFPDPANDAHWMRAPLESNLAEVIWWAEETKPDDPTTPNVDESHGREPGMRRIYRRVLLIPPVGIDLRQLAGGDGGLVRFLMTNDVTVHRDSGSGAIVANTLADLTRREFRYGRGGGSTFPFEFDRSRLPVDTPAFPNASAKYLVLNDALAFDVRVYDPGAPVYSVSGGVLVDPNDPGWQLALTAGSTPVSYGAYVDLGWNDVGTYKASNFTGAPATLFQEEHAAGWHPVLISILNPASRPRTPPCVYDTWSWHYESDGLDEDDSPPSPANNNNPNNNSSDLNVTTGAIDEGLNGRDDPYIPPGSPSGTMPQYVNGVDDVLERETSPPYPVPLRGIKVIFRTYERDARQVREASVTHSFVP